MELPVKEGDDGIPKIHLVELPAQMSTDPGTNMLGEGFPRSGLPVLGQLALLLWGKGALPCRYVLADHGDQQIRGDFLLFRRLFGFGAGGAGQEVLEQNLQLVVTDIRFLLLDQIGDDLPGYGVYIEHTPQLLVYLLGHIFRHTAGAERFCQHR